MNNHIIEYINQRLVANKAILEHVKPENRPIIENAITELEGVLEVAEWKQSLTSKEVKIDGL